MSELGNEQPNEQNESKVKRFKVDVTPDANSLRNYKDLTYTEHYALGEFIDNSITSALKDSKELVSRNSNYALEVEVSFDKAKNTLTIRDNAAGIKEMNIGDALKTGRTARAGGVGLGRYGVGMKAAAFWWGSKLEIITHPIGEPTAWQVIVDISGSEDIEPLVEVTAIEHDSGHGTTVIIHDLWKGVPANTTLNKIKAYLPSIYREYLGSREHEGVQLDFKLIYEGETLSYFAPGLLNAPFWSEHRKKPVGKQSKEWKSLGIVIDLPSGVTVTGWVGILEKMNRDLSGLVLKYKGKIVVGAAALTEDGALSDDAQSIFKPKKIFGQAGSAVSQTIIGEFDMTLVGKTLTTNDVPWTDTDREAFVDQLHKKLTSGDEPLLTMAKNYARRTSSGPKPEVIDIGKSDEKERDSATGAWDNNVDHEPDTTITFGEPDLEIIDGGTIDLSIHDSEGHEHVFTLAIVTDRDRNLYEMISSQNTHKVYVNMFHPLLAEIEDSAEKRLILQKIFLAYSLAVILDGTPDSNALIKKFNQVANKRGLGESNG
jgi:hypothetical protein